MDYVSSDLATQRGWARVEAQYERDGAIASVARGIESDTVAELASRRFAEEVENDLLDTILGVLAEPDMAAVREKVAALYAEKTAEKALDGRSDPREP